MFTVAVVDVHAESRVRLATSINKTLAEPGPDAHLFPRISVVPLAIQELKFHAIPQVVVVGPGLIEQEITTIASIRAQLPDARILTLIPSDRLRLGAVEHLIRLGADDVVDAQASARELLTRLLLLARRIERKAGGKVILVEGVKGGVGTTSVSAALAEMLAKSGKKVVLVDGDANNRCLSRFLRCRPLINENLQLILDGLRSATPEFVAQTTSTVILGDCEVDCLAPPSSETKWNESDGAWIRSFTQTLEVLDETADYVIVDMARLTGKVRETLLRAADGVVLVATQDPACLPAVIERVKNASALLSPEVPLVLLRNERDRDGISASVWRRELRRIDDWAQVRPIDAPLPYVVAASRWPVSGATMFSLGSAKMRAALGATIAALKTPETEQVKGSKVVSFFASCGDGLRSMSSLLVSPLARPARNVPAAEIGSAAIAALIPSERRERLPAKPPQLEFFVSAPTFATQHHARSESAEGDDETLVTRARISVA